MHRHLKLSLLCFFGFILLFGLANVLVLYWFSYTVIIYVPRPVINFLDKTGFHRAMLKPDELSYHNTKQLVQQNFVENSKSGNEVVLMSISEDNVLIEQDICRGDKLLLVILVFSNPSNFERRQVIRQTWLSDVKFNIRYIFVVAWSKNMKVLKELQKESEEHKDILQFDFLDSYRNLTLKTVSSFKWVTESCRNADYVLKIDDDMWLNKKALISVLLRGSLQGALGGSCYSGASPIRDNSSKYYIPESIYPYATYPTFCSGTAYIADMQIVKDIVKVSKSIPYFPLEDIYVAFCMSKLHSRVMNLFGFNSIHVRANPCWLKSDWLITTHEFLPYELRKIWRTRCNGLRVAKFNSGFKPDVVGPLSLKRQQLNRLNMQQFNQRNRRKYFENWNRQINFNNRRLIFN